MSDQNKEFAPSFIMGEIKENKKGRSYFFYGGLYCEVFTSKEGKNLIRATILPQKEDKPKQSPDEKNTNAWRTD